MNGACPEEASGAPLTAAEPDAAEVGETPPNAAGSGALWGEADDFTAEELATAQALAAEFGTEGEGVHEKEDVHEEEEEEPASEAEEVNEDNVTA